MPEATDAMVDIESIWGDEGALWLVSAWEPQHGAVELGWKASTTEKDSPSITFALSAGEAHELGTKLRLMAKKARLAAEWAEEDDGPDA